MTSPTDTIDTRQLPALPPRLPDSNKGTFGRVLVVAGSRGMSGAAVLCASAALRGGAGLVYLAVPSSIQPIVAMANPCYLTSDLPEDTAGRLRAAALPAVQGLLPGKNVLALGPGLGQGDDLTALVLELYQTCPLPLVLDADGLNALVGRWPAPGPPAGSRILTPHPGEFGRLLGLTPAAVQANRRELAVRFARDHGVILVLKGHGTLVTDGRRVFLNTTGNPGLATGGTGDVLTGLIAALVAQGLEPFAAAQLGVWWHGLAGDLARDDLGELSLIASDLLAYLPRAICHARLPDAED